MSKEQTVTVMFKGWRQYGTIPDEAWYRWAVIDFGQHVPDTDDDLDDDIYELIEETLGWYERRVVNEAGDPFARAIHVSLDERGYQALVDQNGGLDI